MSAAPESLALAEAAAAIVEEQGGEDVVAIDVSERLPFTDVFLLVTAGAERHVVAIARELERRLTESGASLTRREGRDTGRWALLDFGDLVVHVFHPEERVFYALDRLWRDCPVIELPAGRLAR